MRLYDWQAAPTTGDWDAQKHKAWEARCMEVYAAQVYRMDQEIGKVLDHLRESGELDNTLVMFLSDNGACPEDVGRLPSAPYKNYEPMADGELQKKIWPPMQTRDGHPVKTGTDAMPGPADSFAAYGENWANVSDTPFRMYKHYVHDGGINTPCIVRWPGVVPPERHGKIVETPGHIIDVMPTFAEAAGTSFPAEYRGDAFVALRGSWNRGRRTGYKVVRLLFENGRPTGVYEDFMTGFVIDDRTVWGRPVGVAVANDGSLFVSEDANGTIWRVTRQKTGSP